MAIYIVKVGVWNNSHTIWDSFQTSVFNAKNLSFIVPGTLHARTGSGMRAHANSCVHRSKASLALLFQKQIYLLIKSYIFHFNISQVNLTSDWALNQSQVLEFQHHQGTGARVINGTKCGVYRQSNQKIRGKTMCMVKIPIRTSCTKITWHKKKLKN